MFSNPTQLSLSDHQKWHLTPFQEWRWGKWAASMVVGKWMGWSERSQIKLGSCWVELHWRVSTGPHWTPWAHTVPPFPEHLTRMKVSHVDYDSVMPPFQHFIRLSVLSFYLLNTARTVSHWGWYLQALFRVQNFLNIIPSFLKSFCSNLQYTLLISGKIFFFFWANTSK